MDLYRRGLKGEQLKLIVTDGNKGMAKARGFVWHRAAHQRCWVHKLRNLSNRLKASQQDCMKQAHNIYVAPNRRDAVVQFRRWKQRWIKEAPVVVANCCNPITYQRWQSAKRYSVRLRISVV